MIEAVLESMMVAVAVGPPGEPDILRIEARRRPRPAEDEVLIKVEAAGLNHVDLRQRKGLNPLDPAHDGVLGLEVAGHIMATGANVRRWRKGDRVCALLLGGGYATCAIAKAALCLPIPASMDTATAAALPEALFTVWSAVVKSGRLKRGETILVYGGSSGIGTAAI